MGFEVLIVVLTLMIYLISGILGSLNLDDTFLENLKRDLVNTCSDNKLMKWHHPHVPLVQIY